MDASIVAALIAGSVALLGVIASVISARWSIRLNSREIDLKTKELDSTIKKLTNDLETVRQSQFSETLRKRLDSYPKLWGTIRNYTINWDDDKPKNLTWVKDFLSALNQVDTDSGVFFSEAVYKKFHELQYFLHLIKENMSKTNATSIDIRDLKKIDNIFRGQQGVPGLAAYLKDDLGSYRDILIQARTVPSIGLSKIEIREKEFDLDAGARTNVFYDSNACEGIEMSDSEIEFISNLRNEWLQNTNAVLLKPSKGVLAIEHVLEKQPGFNDLVDKLRDFIVTKILMQTKRRLDVTEPLLSLGLINPFSVMDLALFVEDEFGVRLEDTELNAATFDTLLELAAIIYSREKYLPKQKS